MDEGLQPEASSSGAGLAAASRRSLLALLPVAAALPLAAALPGPASAAATADELAADLSQLKEGAAPGPGFEPFYDNDYEMVVPGGYTYYETALPVVERGPQPERSPVRARWESPDGAVSISVLMRRAQTVQRTILQVGDVAQWGSVEDVAKLLVPRGAALLGSASITEPRSSRDTPVGPVEIPPRNYYLYEFTTPQGLHVALSAAAQRGNLYVCGVYAPAAAWDGAKDAAAKVVRSFRIKSP